MKKQLFDWISSEISQGEKNGIKVHVNGKYYSDKNKKKLIYDIREGAYMKDYICDETGKIVQINFVRVQNY